MSREKGTGEAAAPLSRTQVAATMVTALIVAAHSSTETQRTDKDFAVPEST